MKVKNCVGCGRDKPISDFALRVNGRLDARCRPCRAAYQHAHYLKHRERYIARAAASRSKLRRERLKLILDHLVESGCVDCGETDPLVLEFDHLSDKSFNIGEEFSTRSWDAVIAEMEKCDVVCANCHVRREAKRSNTIRFRLATIPRQRRLFWSG